MVCKITGGSSIKLFWVGGCSSKGFLWIGEGSSVGCLKVTFLGDGGAFKTFNNFSLCPGILIAYVSGIDTLAFCNQAPKSRPISLESGGVITLYWLFFAVPGFSLLW